MANFEESVIFRKPFYHQISIFRYFGTYFILRWIILAFLICNAYLSLITETTSLTD